jgi:hypothetical protein
MQQASTPRVGVVFKKNPRKSHAPRAQMEVILHMCYNYSKAIKKLIGAITMLKYGLSRRNKAKI